MAAGRSRSRRKNEGKRKNLTERKRKNNDEICLVWCLQLTVKLEIHQIRRMADRSSGKKNTLTNLRLGLLFEIPPSPVSREVVTCLATKCLFHLTFTLSLISDLPSPDMLSRRMYEHRVMEQLACWDSTLYSVSVGISREFSRRVIASHV